jgi:hypothetical protein
MASMSLLGVVIGLFLSEAVIRCERVRANDESVEPRVCGERNANGWRLVAIGAGFVEQLAHSTEVRGFLSERSRDGSVQLGWREALEDLIEPACVAADVSAALGYDLQQFLAIGSDVVKPIESAMLAAATFVDLEFSNVLRVFDLTSPVPSTGVRGDDLVAVQDSNSVERR